MTEQQTIQRIARDLNDLGIRSGDIILVHSSLRSVGSGPETVIQGLLRAVGKAGTLLMPALSYKQKPHHLHSTRETPSNVGVIPEYFRKRRGTLRSVHPTHSVCGVGKAVSELFKYHHLARTPCGPHSPFNRMIDFGAKIVMLGCGLEFNTTMHALEEYENPPYLLGADCVYTIKDGNGKVYARKYRKHGFDGWKQRYDKIVHLPNTNFIRQGKVGEAETFVLDARGLRTAVVTKLQEEPLFFVDRIKGK